MAASPTTTEHRERTELDGGPDIGAVAFSADGEWLVSGDEDGVRVWRVEDGTQIARIRGNGIWNVSVSNDSKLIAASGYYSDVYVWDAQTHEQVIRHSEIGLGSVHGVDLSPDGTRLVVAAESSGSTGKAMIWDVPSRKQIKTLGHKNRVLAAKYSPRGDRIGTATSGAWPGGCVRLYDRDGHLLAEVATKIRIPSYHNAGLAWFNSHLLLVSGSEIIQMDPSTGFIVSQWPIPSVSSYSCVALPKHGKFVAYSSDHTVTFWDTSTHAQLGLIEYRSDVLRSMAVSPDGRLVALGGHDKIVIENLSRINACIVSMFDQGRDQEHSLRRIHDGNPRDSTPPDRRRHDEAVTHYTHAQSIDPPSPQDLLKRAKAFMETGAWQQALDDTYSMIALDPESPWGYEIKYTALHQAGRYDSAVDAFEMMLSKFAKSPDPSIAQHGDRYISPATTRAVIRKIVQQTIRRSPRIMIDTTLGRLHDRAQRESSFESQPIFNELISSMATRIDYVRIKREVRQYFRYAMFSHKWDYNEPLFQRVMGTAVYELEQSPTHDKLQTFCRIVRDAGIKWAWSDTCCIDKSDHIVLQEALVAMFKWYEGAVLTIVFLRGVHSWSQLGALVGSIWNTRGWTLQEYIASKVVHFYTEDWTLYLDLQLPNHKESSKVISEMEQATGVSAEQLKALRPGLSSIREKLRLASPRETTHPEDAAYSLLGIFSVAGLSAIYGEGNASLGRLLAHLLAGSGDVSILAWTGASGSFNSSLPAYISVFSGPETSHLPLPIPDVEMDRIIDTSPPFDLDVALSLYDRLRGLPPPWFTASRMKLPCIAFLLPPLSFHRLGSERVYRADTPTFGTVEIRTRHNLSRMTTLYIVHPWLDSLLGPGDASNAIVDDHAVPLSPNTDDEDIPDEEVDEEVPFVSQPASTDQPLQMDDETRARRFVARLRQPFGALLVTPTGTGRRATPDYKRVAADSLITVRIQENVPLGCILDNVQTLEVL